MTQANHRPRLHRRAVLAGLGAGTAATFVGPLLGQAQGASGPQRLLIIHRPVGTIPDQWWPPTGTGKDWMSSPILAEFEQLRSEMVVLGGLNCPRGNWIGSLPGLGMVGMVTPAPGKDDKWPATSADTGIDPNTRAFTAVDASIDQLLLQNVAGLQGAPIASLQLGVSKQSTQPGTTVVAALSYVKPGGQALATPLLPVVSSAAVRSRLLDASAEPNAAGAAEKQLFDFLSTDVQRLRDRAPATEATKLDAHLAALRELQANRATAACSMPELSPLPAIPPGVTEDEGLYDTISQHQLQLIKAAFQCDLTRVITFSFGTAEAHMRFFKILPPGTINAGDSLYGLSQDSRPASVDARAAIEKYFARKVASLLLELKNTPEARGEGSLLDNTLVVYLTECSGAGYHSAENMPLLAFGGKALGLNGGQYLQFWDGRYVPDFWVSVAQAFGYTDLKAFGAPEWNKGPLPGLFG